MKQDQNSTIFKLPLHTLNQKGQAVVEYILLLVVIVSMLLAAKGLFQGVNTFIGNYVGNYFRCLMDHGELPQLGSAEADLKKHQEQSNCIAKFSINKGATLVGDSSSSTHGTSNLTSTKNSTTGSNPSVKTTNTSDKQVSKNSSKSKSNSSNSADSNESSSYAAGRIKKSNSNSGTADGANDTGQGKVRSIDDEQVAGSAFGRNNTGRLNRTEYKYDRYRAINSGQMFDDIEKSSKRDPRSPNVKNVAKLSAEEGYRPGPRKNTFFPPERKPAAENLDSETDLGFGAIMKWLIIAGIIIAIIVFFGGQIMNYSNSE